MSGQGLMLELSREEVRQLREQVDRQRCVLREIADQLKKWTVASGSQCARCEEDENVTYYAGRKDAFSDAYQLVPEEYLTP